MFKSTRFKCDCGGMVKAFLLTFLVSVLIASPTVNAARSGRAQAALNQLKQENPGLKLSESSTHLISTGNERSIACKVVYFSHPS